MSVSCDCEGVGAAPVVTPNIGIVASTDILAADQASVDLVYTLKDSDHKDLVERIETRHGLRQLSYMKEMHMGNDRYHLINIDEDDKEILGIAGFTCMDRKWNVVLFCFRKKILIAFCWKKCFCTCKIHGNYSSILCEISAGQVQSFHIFLLIGASTHAA